MREEFKALLNLHSYRLDAFSDDFIHLLEKLQPTLAAIVEAWRFEEQLRELNRFLEQRVRSRTFELQTLYELAQKLNEAIDHSALFRMLLVHLRPVIQCDLAAILLMLDGEPELLVFSIAPLTPQLMTILRNDLVAMLRKQNGETLQKISTKRIKSRFFGLFEHTPLSPPLDDLGALCRLPLLFGVEQQPMGAMLIARSGASCFSAEHRRLLHTIAHHISGVLQRFQMMRASEQKRLAALIEHLPIGVVLLNPEGCIRLHNPRGREYLSLLCPEAELGTHLKRLGHIQIQDMINSEEQRFSIDIIGEDSPERIFEIRFNKILDGTETSGYVLMLQDVTQERTLLRLERERKQELDGLYQLSSHLVAANSLQEVLTSFAEHAVELLGISFVRILMREEQPGFVCRAAAERHDMQSGILMPGESVSSDFAEMLEKRIAYWIEMATQETRKLVNSNWEKIVKVANALIEKEMIDGEEIKRIMES